MDWFIIHALHDCNASHKGYRKQERAPGTHWWYLITWLTFITSELWRHVPWHIASTRLSICDRSSVTYSQQTCYNVHVTTTITRKQFCMKFHNERVCTCMYMQYYVYEIHNRWLHAHGDSQMGSIPSSPDIKKAECVFSQATYTCIKCSVDCLVI